MKQRPRSLHGPARRLDQELDRVLKESFKAGTNPAFLYHYTRWDRAAGILCSQRLRASAHDCVNDTGEIQAANEIIIEVATTLLDQAKGDAATILETFTQNYFASQIANLRTIYLSCFSTARDDLGQWRLYADGGRGVCLGIRILNEPAPRYPALGVELFEVDYSKHSWREKILRGFGEVCSLIGRAKSVSRKQRLKLGLSKLYEIAAKAAICAKEAKWAQEREFRLIAFVREVDDISRYEQRDGERRYIPLAVREEGRLIAVDEFIIGPNQDSAKGMEKAKELLSSAGYRAGQIEYPNIVTSARLWTPRPDSSA